MMTSSNRNRLIFFALLFVLTEFFGWKYWGPISIRNIGLILATFSLFWINWKYDKRLFGRFKFLVIYYVIVSVLGLFNGFYLDMGATFVFSRFLPTIVLFCFATSCCINDEKSFSWLVYFLLLIMSVDAFATILQGRGSPIGWALHAQTNGADIVDASFEKYGDYENSIGHSYASGLMGTVVVNGFFLTALGSLFWYPYYKRRSLFSFFISLLLFLLCLTALFYNQQRLAFFVYLFITAIVAFFLIRSKSLRIGYVFLIVMAGLFFLGHTHLFDSLNIGRLALVTDSDVFNRHTVHRTYYSEFFPYHYLTGDRHEFFVRYATTPHNIVIETLLLGGVIGLGFFFMFVASLLVSLVQDLKAGRVESVLFAAPIMAILLISLEHSSGFHTGLTICASLMALYEVSRVRDEMNKSELSRNTI